MPAIEDQAGPVDSHSVETEESIRNRGIKLRWLAAASALFVAAGGGIWFAFHGGADDVAPVTKTHTVTGTMTVSGEFGSDGSCGGSESDLQILEGVIDGKTFPCPGGPGGGYSDIAEGAQVTIKDGSGKLLAVGNLTGGVVSQSGVSFEFEVPKVKETAFYQVEVAHRGALNFPIADMKTNHWAVALSLG